MLGEPSTPASFRLILRKPKLVQKDTRLQFEVAVQVATGNELFCIKGWSVYQGRIYPPSRAVGRVWMPVVAWGPGTEPERYLRVLLEPWRLLYPAIQFDSLEGVS